MLNKSQIRGNLMDDMERYGDYTEYEDDIPKKRKNPVMLILKILIALVCLSVIGIFAFRMIAFSYYPDSVQNIYFNDTLTAYYNSVNGDIKATTQELRAPYDDPKTGVFFADNLIVIEGAQQIQCSVRLNRGAFDDLSEKHGVTLAAGAENMFTFRLSRNHATLDGEFVPIGTVTVIETDSALMYEYYKLVFDGVDLKNGTVDEVKWLSLEISVNGAEMEEPYRIPIYENNSAYSSFDEYELSSKEHP